MVGGVRMGCKMPGLLSWANVCGQKHEIFRSLLGAWRLAWQRQLAVPAHARQLSSMMTRLLYFLLLSSLAAAAKYFIVVHLSSLQ